MHLILNAFLLVAGYRLSFQHLRRGGAVVLGVVLGILMAGTTWIMLSGQGMHVKHFAAVAAVEVAVLVPSFWLSTRRDGILIAILNVVAGSAAALYLPFVAVEAVGK